jgi:hypothetical protein
MNQNGTFTDQKIARHFTVCAIGTSEVGANQNMFAQNFCAGILILVAVSELIEYTFLYYKNVLYR